MRTDDFDFKLPNVLIAQVPAPERDNSRLLVLQRNQPKIEHRKFPALLEYLQAGDVLALNNSRVIPARLRGFNATTNGQFKFLLLKETAVNDWWAMMRPAKRARLGSQITLRKNRGGPTEVHATVVETNSEGHRRLHFDGTPNIANELDDFGEVPLPPYITRADRSNNEQDRSRYQTIFAKYPGSVAAPTAGLHFTPALLKKICERGVNTCFVTLHVGLGTFAPIKSETIAGHRMHEEYFDLSEQSAAIINKARDTGKRIFAVGTTTLRVLETAARNAGSSSSCHVSPISGKTALFIYPPYEFKIVDALVTNFHLPRSTLLMLVSAFAAPGDTRGREWILSAYEEAIRLRYRFFSYGDAMLVL